MAELAFVRHERNNAQLYYELSNKTSATAELKEEKY